MRQHQSSTVACELMDAWYSTLWRGAHMKARGIHRGLESWKLLLDDLRKGLVRPVYAFVGERYFTERAARKVIETLVPAAERLWNVERYDGQNVAWQQLFHSLKTPGFGASTKVVWLKDTGILAGRERGQGSADGMLRDWAHGKRSEAAEKLLESLSKAGWDTTRFEALLQSAFPTEDQVEIFGRSLDDAECEEMRNIFQFALSCNKVGSSSPDPVRGLLQVLTDGLPPRVALLVTAESVDQRGRLWRKIQEAGLALLFVVDRERNQALTREAATGVIEQIVREHGKRLGSKALDLLVQRAGVEVERLASEVEKLCLWVGQGAEIQPKDVLEATADLAESWVFDLTGALSRRDCAASLETLHDLLSRGEQPLRLVALIARELRALLLARECLERDLIEPPSVPNPGATSTAGPGKPAGAGQNTSSDNFARSLGRSLSDYGTFSKVLLPRIPAEQLEAFGRPHPYVLFRRFQEALLWSVEDLRTALTELASVEHQLKTSNLGGRILLEGFLFRWCSSPKTLPLKAQ